MKVYEDQRKGIANLYQLAQKLSVGVYKALIYCESGRGLLTIGQGALREPLGVILARPRVLSLFPSLT